MTTHSQSSPDANASSITLPGNHPDLQLTGRFHSTPESNLVFAWPGTKVTVRFTGTALDVTLDDLSPRQDGETEGNYLAIILDDNPLQTLDLRPGTFTYRLADDLPNGEHTVTLFKQTEPSIGGVELKEFTLWNGSTLPPLPRPERRIEFYGDSITCGYGNEGLQPTEPFKPSTENHYLSYGQLTARELSAACHIAAWSGEGIIRNALGEVVNPLPSIYDTVLPPSSQPGWDFSKWVPQVVVIHLGTNDFLSGIPDKETFIKAYLSFLQKLYRHYDNPYIFCCVGPLLNDIEPQGENRLSTARSYLEEIKYRAEQNGILTIQLVEFEPIKPNEFGAWWHPNLLAHRRMATTLTAAIKKTTGW